MPVEARHGSATIRYTARLLLASDAPAIYRPHEDAMLLSHHDAQPMPTEASWVWEPDARRLWWNAAAVDMIGAAPGQHARFVLTLVHPEDRGRLLEEVRRSRLSASPFALACRFVRPDCQTRLLALRPPRAPRSPSRPTCQGQEHRP